MKTKQFIIGISLFVTPKMYGELKSISDIRRISLSELVRGFVLNGLEGSVTSGNGGKE